MYLMTTTRHVALDPSTGSIIRDATAIEIDAYRAAERAARHGILRGAVRCGNVSIDCLRSAPKMTAAQQEAQLRADWIF